jgi:hypothetical protein
MKRTGASFQKTRELRRRSAGAPTRLAILLAFFAIYVVWGSTYLAIRYAVETIPPLIVAGIRHVVAGAVLLGWAYAQGHRPSLEEWRASAILAPVFRHRTRQPALGRDGSAVRLGCLADRY